MVIGACVLDGLLNSVFLGVISLIIDYYNEVVIRIHLWENSQVRNKQCTLVVNLQEQTIGVNRKTNAIIVGNNRSIIAFHIDIVGLRVH